MSSKTVWIIGASSGIGAAVAERYARENYKLILSARSEGKLAEICERSSAECVVFPLDVSASADMNEKVNKLWSENGPVDIVVYSAGITQRAQALETKLAVDRQIMEVNYFGAVAAAKAIVPLMIENGGGKMVVLTSVMGKFSSPMRTAYAASKHALHGFFDGLRAETADTGMTFTLVAPGFVKTGISYHSLKGNGKPYGKMAEPQANGMHPDRLADIIVKAADKGSLEIAPGGIWERLGLYLKRFFPSIFARAIVKKNVT